MNSNQRFILGGFALTFIPIVRKVVACCRKARSSAKPQIPQCTSLVPGSVTARLCSAKRCPDDRLPNSTVDATPIETPTSGEIGLAERWFHRSSESTWHGENALDSDGALAQDPTMPDLDWSQREVEHGSIHELVRHIRDMAEQSALGAAPQTPREVGLGGEAQAYPFRKGN